MEFVQDLLTAVTQIIAIAGFGCIVAHAFYTHHCNWMATHCPPVGYKEISCHGEVIVSGIEDTEYDDGVTGEYGVEVVEEETRADVPTEPKQPEIELNALDPTTLRSLCTQYGITWKNVRGKGKHLTKAAMIFQLERVAA